MATTKQLIDLGPSQIIFAGGEPAYRIPLLLKILDHFKASEVQFWINTSGTGLDREALQQLKAAGLTGVIFSLDHFDEREHDRFRGTFGCYRQAIQMIEAANELDLVTALSLCATNRFATRSNMESYMQRAAELDVAFVQLLEPKPAGKYEGRSVQLENEKKEMLQSFRRYASRRRDWPILVYPDLESRRYGCSGGKQYLYVDVEGRAYPCPFCKEAPVELAALTPSNVASRLACPFGG